MVVLFVVVCLLKVCIFVVYIGVFMDGKMFSNMDLFWNWLLLIIFRLFLVRVKVGVGDLIVGSLLMVLIVFFCRVICVMGIVC